MSQSNENGSIDDKIFIPLSQFLVDGEQNIEELKKLIDEKGIPAGVQSYDQLRGFLAEMYAMVLLKKFSSVLVRRPFPTAAQIKSNTPTATAAEINMIRFL